MQQLEEDCASPEALIATVIFVWIFLSVGLILLGLLPCVRLPLLPHCRCPEFIENVLASRHISRCIRTTTPIIMPWLGQDVVETYCQVN
eukprot:COSAG02_NODE_396_length_23126_cov_282.150258_16_plen_89_part_00